MYYLVYDVHSRHRLVLTKHFGNRYQEQGIVVFLVKVRWASRRSVRLRMVQPALDVGSTDARHKWDVEYGDSVVDVELNSSFSIGLATSIRRRSHS